MARNEEKQLGRLNRLILSKEKEEYDIKNPQRPRLDSLYSVDEIKKWLPSIKNDIEFYLKKSQVTCYSDQHIGECREKIVKLEKEFKAFVRKIKQLSPDASDPIPWTNRAYKRKNNDLLDTKAKKEFVHIASPILEQEKIKPKTCVPVENLPLMDKPLNFNSSFQDGGGKLEQFNVNTQTKCDSVFVNNNLSFIPKLCSLTHNSDVATTRKTPSALVNYDYSSDSDCS